MVNFEPNPIDWKRKQNSWVHQAVISIGGFIHGWQVFHANQFMRRFNGRTGAALASIQFRVENPDAKFEIV